VEDLLVLRVSLQENNKNSEPNNSELENSYLEISFWYWIETNYKYEEAIKKVFNKY
jgi:hypothetical protein